jgi:quinate/shikimate dehydrogenase (NAD+)
MNVLVRTLAIGREILRTERHEVGLVGAGIGASLSPALHEREAAEQGLSYAYRLIDIDERGLSRANVGELLREAHDAGFSGLNVTHPCKQAVVPHLDALSDDAAALQAVNTVVFEDGRATGHNTDTTGFGESFVRGLPGVAVKNVVLLGAGGGGTAVAYAALRLGVQRLTVVDIDRERAHACVRQLRSDRVVAGTLDSLADADGLIHATPTGMEGHRPGMPLDGELLHPGLWVAEIVYRPLETALLRHARELGCQTLDGGGMAVFQAADAFELFTGVEPDRERMLRHFEDLAAEPIATGGAR